MMPWGSVRDEVITTPFTFVATAETIGLLGASRCMDIDPRTFNLDPSRIAAAITPRTSHHPGSSLTAAR
jgi:UDP-2-acetamido-2-deoxy-ribo-hexuluronate aminotransferase